jgi:hypothetical protein
MFEQLRDARFLLNQYLPCAASFVAAFYVFPCFFENLVFPAPVSGPSWLNLDPSWKLMLNRVNAEGLQWGDDVVFTYGPLAWLSTKVGWGLTKYHFLFFDLFCFLNFWVIFYRSIKLLGQNALSYFLVAGAVLLVPAPVGAATALMLLGFLVFWLVMSVKKPSFANIVIQVVIVTLAFFMKLNSGLICAFLFGMGCVYRCFHDRKRFIQEMVSILTMIAALLFCARVWNVHLAGYIKGGLELVSGYNDVMYLEEPYQKEMKFAGALIVCVLVFFVSGKSKKEVFHPENLLYLSVAFIALYVLYKQGFVRRDIQHVREFYGFILFFLIVLLPALTASLQRQQVLITLCLFCALFAGKGKDEHFFNSWRFNKAGYFSGLRNFNDTSGLKIYNGENVFSRLQAKVGSASIDIYPWNVSFLIENKLHFEPRPVFQSYTAYTEYLQQLNLKKYKNAPPKFILYDFDAIDNRYPLFDEPLLNCFVAVNYHISDTFTIGNRFNLLFEKKDTVKSLSPSKIFEFSQDLSKEITPAANHLYKIKIRHSLKGGLRSVISHAPSLVLRIKCADGSFRDYRTSAKLLEGGIYGDQLFQGTRDYYGYLQFHRADGNKRIVSFTLIPERADDFEQKIRVEEFLLPGV